VAQRDFEVTLQQAEPFRVVLQPGRQVAGIVVNAADGSPVAGATVTPVEAKLLRPAETDAAGRFTLGATAAASVTLSVEHPHFEALRLGPVPAGEDLRVALEQRPLRTVAGTVRGRPGLQPVAGAEVKLVAGGATVEAAQKTAADGAFALRTAATGVLLEVAADGFLVYREVIDGEAAALTCDLIPATAEARVAAGMTAMVEGRVVDAAGAPAPGVPVQLTAADPVFPEGIANRAIMAGGILVLSPITIADAEGRFSIESDAKGPARLQPIDGVTTEAEAVSIQLVPGRRQEGVVLRMRSR
jgi:hypothetical protein